jgi:hypothetical protein
MSVDLGGSSNGAWPYIRNIGICLHATWRFRHR